MSSDDYLTRIEAARVYDVATETPLELAGNLSARLRNRVLLKREDLQSVFSFKLRGAYNKLANLPQDVLDRGVICSSAGNHAQGVALAAARMGARAVIVMPVTTPSIKVDAVRALGGEVVLHGDTYDDAQRACERTGRRTEPHLHPSFRRSGRDRRPGNDRARNPEAGRRQRSTRSSCRSAAAG